MQEKERGDEGQKQYSEAEKQALILEFLAKNDKDKAILREY